jgi:hypothetical protein
MTRKNSQTQIPGRDEPETREIFPPEGGVREPELSGAVSAAEEKQAEAAPEQNLQPPPLQQPAKKFTIKDCYADESEPPPTPPQKYNVLRHSGGLPKSAFSILPRENGKKIILNMVGVPFGEAEQGQPFAFPVPQELIKPIADECPTLTVKRYEIRVAGDAANRPSLVEVPFDRLMNKIGEHNRQSLLNTIEIAESKAIIAQKMPGGGWTYVDAPNFEPASFAQTQEELVDLTYGPEFITSMDSMALRKFRRKV